MIEIRTYTMASAEALEEYATVRWARHITSLATHGIVTHHVWIETGADAHRLIAVVEYPEGADPAALTEEYMASAGFREDMEGFPIADIVDVTTTWAVPAASDPSAD